MRGADTGHTGRDSTNGNAQSRQVRRHREWAPGWQGLGKEYAGRRKLRGRGFLFFFLSAICMMNLGKLQEMVRDREAWHAEVHGANRESDMT